MRSNTLEAQMGALPSNEELSSRSETNSKIAAKRTATAKEFPLEWTKIKRRKGQTRIEINSDENADFCCDDGSCLNGKAAGKQHSKAAASTITANTGRSRKRSSDEGEKWTSNVDYTTIKGKALFCLHSLDCSWFQGQFIKCNNDSISTDAVVDPSTRQEDIVKSLGLLAKRRIDIDECLKCSDGGYGEIDLIVLGRNCQDEGDIDFHPKEVGHQTMTTRKSFTVERLICTGGDMLRIRNSFSTTTSMASSDSNVIVSFDAERIITDGGKVEYLTRRYFPNLLPPSIGLTTDHSVLTHFPDCAIVVGNMSLSLPNYFLLNKKR
jgi:hypothetical protein